MDEQGTQNTLCYDPRLPCAIETLSSGTPDQMWLDALNAERRKEQLDQVSYETFEIIMDRLEKEWFELVRHVLLLTRGTIERLNQFCYPDEARSEAGE